MNIKKKIIIFFIIFLTTLFFSFGLYYRLKYKNILAVVGNELVNKKELTLQKKINQCLRKNIDKSYLLSELILNKVKKQALQKFFNVFITEDEIKKESEKIKKNEKKNFAIRCIKNSFLNDRYNYLNFYIANLLYNKLLEKNFSLSKTIHKKEFSKIKNIFNQIKKGKKIESFPGYKEVAVYETTTTLPSQFNELKKYGITTIDKLPKDLQKTIIQNIKKNPLVEDILKKLKPGEINKNIVEDKNSYKIVKLIKKESNKKYLCGIIQVSKTELREWIKKYTKNINIEIKDSFLKQEIEKKCPDFYCPSKMKKP